MRTIILCQIPNPHTSSTITTYNLALVRVNHYIVDRASMGIAALHGTTSRLPDLDSTVLGTRHHPFPLAVKRDACYIARVAFECEERVRIRGFDVVELHGVVAGCGEEPFVG